MNLPTRGAHRGRPAALPNTPPGVIDNIFGLSGFEGS
jgi:hypothetical protein